MKTKWNLTLLYKSDNDPQIQKDIDKSIKNVKAFVKNWKTNKEYTKDPKILKKALDEYENLIATTGICSKPSYYIELRNAQDQTNPSIKEIFSRISDTCINLENEIQFFELNIAKIPKSKQQLFVNSDELLDYKHYLEGIFKGSKYLLSDKEEKIFNITSRTAYENWVAMIKELTNKQTATILDENMKEKEVSYNELMGYLRSTNKKVRDYANIKFNEINNKYAEIAEFEINSVLGAKKAEDEYRKIPRPDLGRHLADDIESDIVDTLVDTVTKHFDISHRYYKRKAELMGQKKLGYYERNVPLEGKLREYSYDESMKLIQKIFNDLDPDFGNIVKRYSEQGQYDVYPKAGKSGGAFCASMPKDLLTFILLNHKNKLTDVTTIAHESGHGIHAELHKKQNALNDSSPTSLAEVASTFFEDFVYEEVLKDVQEEKESKAILDGKLMDDISTIFRQVAFYNFETELHHDFREKGFLTKEYISDLFCKHMKAYLGDTVEEDQGMRNGWIYVSHFRRFFYVYSYASGLLISKALQKMVKNDKKSIVYVKRFMESGSTQSPKELFKEIGIDITKKEFWENGIEEINVLLNKL